jgi:tetratricopeptide (TPR) repeat protein
MHTGRVDNRPTSSSLPTTFWLAMVFLFPFRTMAQSENQQKESIGTSAKELVNNLRAPDVQLLKLKENYNQALQENRDVDAAGYLQQIGQLLFISAHYPQSLDYLLRSEKLLRTADQKQMLAANLGLLGELYYRTRRPQLARKQYDEALGIYQTLKLESGKAEIYGRIGHLYEKRQLYDSAFYFQRKALTSYQLDNHIEGAAKIYENVGSIYEDLEKLTPPFTISTKPTLSTSKRAMRGHR